jgi:hypothetical protein
MAWKRLSQGATTYYVNLNQIAYLQQYQSTTGVFFSAASGDNRRLSISVDQSPDEILGSEVRH